MQIVKLHSKLKKLSSRNLLQKYKYLNYVLTQQVLKLQIVKLIST